MSRLKVYTCLSVFVHAAWSSKDPDSGKSISQLVRSRGFGFEEIPIITANKYLVKLHHILRPEKCKNEDPRKVLVFGIPLGGSSDLYVMDFVNNSWGFYFADKCFDVWLTNVRGNRHGKQYANGSVASAFDKKFFDYTLVDIGKEDLTAQVDFILERTGQQQIFYLGMSQGAMSFFAMCAKRPEYNAKVRAMVSLGGLRSLCNMTLFALRAARALSHAVRRNLINGFYIEGLNGNFDAASPFCHRFSQACFYISLLFAMKNDHGKYMNKSRVGVYLEHFPDGSSVKNLMYMTQLMESCGVVRDFDEDMFEDRNLIHENPEKYSKNLKKYGTIFPPELKASEITVPVKLYYSDGDDLATPAENKRLRETLPGYKDEYYIRDKTFGHASFIVVPYNRKMLNDVQEYFESFLK